MRFFNNRPLVITILLSVLLVVLMIVTPGSGRLTGPESVAGTAVSGTQSFLGSLVDGVGHFFSSIFSPNETEEENQQLKEQIASLQQEVQTADELKTENERLKSLLNYVQNHTCLLYTSTGVCLYQKAAEKRYSGYRRTRVWFAPMTPQQMDAYIRTGEPMDKAGAYGIQGRAAAYIQRIDGCYFNVVGLPVQLLADLCRQAGLL